VTKSSKLPLIVKVMYGAGSGGIALILLVIGMWAVYFYAPPSGRGLITYVPMALLGIAMGVGRLFDAITDPIIGQWSDRTHSRWGRRIPFILFGAVPFILSFILVWLPPVSGISIVNFVYLSLMLSLFFLFYTIVSCPYSALLPELTSSSEERISLATWQGFFRILGFTIGFLGVPILIEKMGFKAMAIILGVVALFGLYCPVLAVRGRNLPTKKSELAFRQSIVQTFMNKPFKYFIGGYMFFWFAFTILTMGISYMVTVLIGLSEGDVGSIVAPSLAIVILSFPLIQRVASKKGKKFTFMLSLTLLCIAFFLIPSIGHWPFGISKAVQGRILVGLCAIPVTALFVLPNAMIADLVDYDERVTGSRREAMYFGMKGLMLKLAIALSSLFFGFVLSTFGYSSVAPLGVLLLGPVAGIFVLIGLLIFSRYPISA